MLQRHEVEDYDALHYNYQLQAWIEDGYVDPCNHPESMGDHCCNGRRYARLSEAAALKRASREGNTHSTRRIFWIAGEQVYSEDE